MKAWSLLAVGVILYILNADGLRISRLETISPEGTCPMTVTCEVAFETEHELSLSGTGNWSMNDEYRDNFDVRTLESTLEAPTSYSLVIPCEPANLGNLTCSVALDDETFAEQSIELHFAVAPKILSTKGLEVKLGEQARLTCEARGHPAPAVTWTVNSLPLSVLPNKPQIQEETSDYVSKSQIDFASVERSDNGSYICTAANDHGAAKRVAVLLVKSAPTVQIDSAFGISQTQIYLNWTLNNGNSPILLYRVKYLKEGTDQWMFSGDPPPSVTGTSHIIGKLEPDTKYRLQIEAKNEFGTSPAHELEQSVSTLDFDPDFVPSPTVKGSTKNSLTLGWTLPPEDLRFFFSHYTVLLNSSRGSETHNVSLTHHARTEHLFGNLKPATVYSLRIRACLRFANGCGEYSALVDGSTLDGEPSPPQNLQVTCRAGEDGRGYQVTATWDPPAESNGIIQRYSVRLTGVAHYYDKNGKETQEKLGPMARTVNIKKLQFTFDDMHPNTAYTVQINAVTKSSQGLPAEAVCQTAPTLPNREALSPLGWAQTNERGFWMFRMSIPRLTERNGRICCYAVVMVKLTLNESSLHQLPEPSKQVLKTYTEVHVQGAGAYVAELIDPDSLTDSVLLGDGEAHSSQSQRCSQCVWAGSSKRSSRESSTLDEPDFTQVEVRDGYLDSDSNYTAFVKVYGFGDNGVDSLSSPYLNPLTPKPLVSSEESQDRPVVLIVALGVLCGVACVLLVLVLVLVMLKRYSKNIADAEGVEMSLSSTCRHLWRRFHNDRQLLVSVPSISSSPILKDGIVQAYLERHQNGDYGFQHEFEMLPERFSDRTTRATDTKENLPKNRYPDIKAYDQTRVKLAVVDAVPHSDYINANVVMGYKERKKFICAQGPMESTVEDFWRMAWEQRVEVIVMLTNIEEYNKTKCFQYWPDLAAEASATPEPVYLDPVSDTPTEEKAPPLPAINGSTPKANPKQLYGDISVLNVKEKRFSEYVVREFQVSKQKSSTSISDPELGVLEREVRPVFQYHYQAWKDFQAPEHAHGLLRFLRRLNEDYSTDRGPILVHCSAGVGRTGTLVAIDHLTQQIEEEGCVSVFNTVYDLRHQRNFLVQSLRQYIFVYRALMEWVQFGNTEIPVDDFEEALQRMRLKGDSGKSMLEEEFERLAQIVEDPKPMAVAKSDENKAKNRHETAVPYDRSRVILTPVPGREYSTYINASFIEGFDNSESFILAQDPLESTARDFWRMVLEHNISTLVMLSEMGAEPLKCPQYWADDTKEQTFDNIVVKHLSSVSLPALIRRDFLVVNTKSMDEIRTTQLQLLCWPAAPAEVPAAARDESVPSAHHTGIVVSAALEILERRALGGPACIHCSTGSLRSSVVAALCILIEQARVEGYVDVFSLVRKLRSQRLLMVQSQSHYTFLYDALAFYLKTNPAASLPPSP